jgi:hypothetical protein
MKKTVKSSQKNALLDICDWAQKEILKKDEGGRRNKGFKIMEADTIPQNSSALIPVFPFFNK